MKTIDTTRVIIHQPALPAYRIPVFRELARRFGIMLRVIHGRSSSLANADSEGFDAECAPGWHGRFLGRSLYWHAAQIRCATRAEVDVLILPWDLHYASLVPALIRARLNGVRTIVWGHGYSKREAGWRRWLRDRVARLATAVLVYNRATAEQVAERGLDRRRVFVALNALDQGPIQAAREDWRSDPEKLEEFRRDNALDRGPVVLFVSRLEPENRADLLMHAVARLAADYPTLQAVIIGRGDEQRNALESLATDLGVADRIRFLGPIYDENQLAPWFLSSSVFCYPANIGLSILHAFGYGLPVVTSDQTTAQNPEIEALRPGENGMVYPDGDVHALADVLRRLFDDQGLLEEMSGQALETALNQFTLSAMVDGMENAVRFCIDAGPCTTIDQPT